MTHYVEGGGVWEDPFRAACGVEVWWDKAFHHAVVPPGCVDCPACRRVLADRAIREAAGPAAAPLVDSTP